MLRSSAQSQHRHTPDYWVAKGIDRLENDPPFWKPILRCVRAEYVLGLADKPSQTVLLTIYNEPRYVVSL